MSFKAFVWAWDQEVPNGDYHHVLLALANIAPSREVRASVPYIAKQVRRSTRKVRLALDWLAEAQIITVTERPGKVDVIRLNIPANFQVNMPDEDDDLEMGTRGRPRKTPAPSENAAAKSPPKPLSNPSHRGSDEPLEPTEPISSLRSESSNVPSDSARFAELDGDDYGEDPPEDDEVIDAEFEDAGAPPVESTALVVVPDDPRTQFSRWWAIWLKKIGKPSAEKAFKQAIKHVAFNDLMERTIEYWTMASDARFTDRAQFIPHPATWLNDHRWETDIDDARQMVYGSRSRGGRATMADVLAAGEILNGYDEDPRF